ncbi:DUF4097 family beta strand repeat-containing protein [Streptomyces sp. NPDC059832]|uniref:DUF4097 family beta strand repeat-containing protein n=1 Tax=unclassified Streptomyces TaxID=2593676 RepID=UPI003646D72B
MKIRFRAFLLSGVMVLAAAPVLSACDQYDDSDSRSFDVKDRVTGVTIDSRGGDITVVAGDGDAVNVTENLKYKSDKKPSTEHFVRGKQLHLDVATDCGSSLGSADCSVNYRVEVPRGVAVDLKSGGGDIHLDGVSGGVDASAGGGEVKAENMAAQKLKAASGGGSIDLTWAKTPDDVDVNAKGGNVTLHVPDSGYQVSASTTLGSEKVEVKKDSSSERRIKARTFAGDVKVLVAG